MRSRMKVWPWTCLAAATTRPSSLVRADTHLQGRRVRTTYVILHIMHIRIHNQKWKQL